MKKVLLIQTGGTIAMQAQKDGISLDPEKWSEHLYKQIPLLQDIASIDVEPLLFEDSSDLHPTDWNKLLASIETHYEQYDGFVVLHGTDTMAYTSSALSFSIQQLNKPIIFTGSQVPLSRIRSDAQRNLVNSIEIATSELHEVAICFNDHVFRANRATKMSIGDFDAFSTPNYPELAEIGLEIDYHKKNWLGWPSLNHEHSATQTSFAQGFQGEILVLTIHPGFRPSLLDSVDLNLYDAVILRAYGSGNFPIKSDYSWLPFIEKCNELQIITVITSQANHDSVKLTNYSSGSIAATNGALSSGDMTLEACITKLMWLFYHYSDKEMIARLFQENLKGEKSTY